MASEKRYNEDFISLMEKLHEIMMKHGEPFRAKAYQKAQDTIMTYPSIITSVEQLSGLPGIGPTIMDKLKEYVQTGSLRILELEKTNPINILTDVYGIGPKKAEELVNLGVKSIAELRSRQNELLNDVQKVGLHFYEDILQRIPRSEIEEYKIIFSNSFVKTNNSDAFEIVGSYRRGAANSGDIDVIITGQNGASYSGLIDELVKRKIILHILSRGPSKTLVIARLPNSLVARRLDFLYAPPDEFAFAILYFTGSKVFNTVMRQKALDQGYTFNEHGIYHLVNKKKDKKVDHHFPNEHSIFDFLHIPYKNPIDRAYLDLSAALHTSDKPSITTPTLQKVASLPTSDKPSLTSDKNKTRKKKVISGAIKPSIVFDIVEDTNKEAEEKILLQNFVKNGIETLNSLGENDLSNMLRYAAKQYYNLLPVISDNQFDIIKNFIENKFPANKAIKEIGAEVERNKVTLPYEMASMDKIKPDTNALANWCQKFNGPYVLSCKLDGVSGLYSFKQGSEPKLYTRGNGLVGQDVSHLIPYLKLPANKTVVLRGEFIISKQVFTNKYANKFANIRNMVAGIINHKTITDSVNDLEFVAYEVIEPQLKPSEQISLIKSMNIKCVLSNQINRLTNEMLSSLLVDWRSNYAYEIDGIIVTNDGIVSRTKGNPEHAFAFKMVLSDQIAEAIVTNVIWTPSKDGYLKPRVQIEPLNLGGVKIEYATGFNGAFIKDNKVGIGATVELIRSGDVIPHIKSIIVPSSEPKMPDVPYKWNDTGVDIMLINADEDPIVKEKNITGFFKGIEVDGLGGGNVARIIEAGYDTVSKIIKMNESDFLKVEGFKGKMAAKIYTGIQKKLEEASIVTIMAASNIFGRGFSDKKLELILKEQPDILVSTKTFGQKVNIVSAIKGMAEKTATTFVSKIEEFKVFLKEAGLENKLDIQESPNSDVSINKSSPLFGKTIVLTGTRDKTVLEILKKVGATQGSNVSKNTFLVVAKSADDDTGKAEEARKLGITILSVDQFTKLYLI
jgi:DNA ligase (NAD+)